MKVRFLPQAFEDIDRLQAFLLDKNAQAAARVPDLLYNAATSLRIAPRKGRLVGRVYRDLIVPFGKSAYVLRYRIEEAKGAIFIVRIWHSRERRR